MLVSWRQIEFMIGMDRRQLQNLASKAPRFYEPFDVLKRSGNGCRHIDNPTGLLKDVQGRIMRKILRPVSLPRNMVGGVAGRSVRDNALAHIGQPTLVKLDLRNHFGRITNDQVFAALRRELGMSTEIAAVLTQLTTLQHRLPQGAATSTALSNLVLLPAHREITRLAADHACRYTLFVDDITISGSAARAMIQPTIAVLHLNGFALAADKLEIVDRCERQATTGIVVNRRMTIARQEREAIRREVLQHAANPSMSDRDFRSLVGRIRYVAFIDINSGERLAELADRRLPPRVADHLVDRPHRHLPCRGAHRYRPTPRAAQNETATVSIDAATSLPDSFR
ncbi:MAG TPA: reverse transcriptase family protein [Kofleriaceae bacterium]|nr:reverse transcriptase family protein [Kofleriaceae bacterium]